MKEPEFSVYIMPTLNNIAPIHGICVENINDKNTWKLTYKSEATPIQKLSAQNYINTVNVDTIEFNRKMENVRIKRNDKLKKTDFIVTRHRDQLANSDPTTLSPSQYSNWLDYRTLLRNLPETITQENIDSFDWPTEPE